MRRRAEQGQGVKRAGLQRALVAVTAFGLAACSAPMADGPAVGATDASPPTTSPSDRAASTPLVTSSAQPAQPGTRVAPSLRPAATATDGPRLLVRWRGKVVTELPRAGRTVALTIDCGGSAAGLPSILATLRRKQVTATFFVTGEFARAHPGGLRRIAADGHAIGNHTDRHANLAHSSSTQVRGQLRRAERAIRRAAGVPAKPWFRFPFGSYDAAALQAVNRAGYVAIGWTVDSLGWQGTSAGHSAGSVRRRVLAAAQRGAIVLMHAGANPQDNSTLDADALPGIIRGFGKRGYGFTTIPAGLAR